MLRALLLLPLFGAGLLALVPARRVDLLRQLASLAAGATLVCSLLLLVAFDPDGGAIQFFETRPWNPRVGAHFALGLDGVSLPMVLLATLLCFLAIACSTGVRTGAKLYFSLLLVLESALLVVFSARDWSLFYVAWELTLIPLFFLIDRLGGAHRHRAALNFVLYTLGGSVFLLIALLLLYDVAPGHSFAMADMAAGGAQLPARTQVLVFLGLLVGFGVKMPIVPLHGWLPLAHVEAPSPVSILLSGVLLKMGAYGLIRAAWTLPAAALAMQDWLALLALASLIHGAVLAWRQTDLKAMIAYSSISHMGVVLLGIAALNHAGLSGAMTQMVAHGLVAGLLFLLVGLLYERTHSRELAAYRSLHASAPRFAALIAFALLAAVGLPGGAGFVAEVQVLIGAYGRWGGWLLFASLGMLISAAYALRAIRCVWSGPGRAVRTGISGGSSRIDDLKRSEYAAAGLLAVGIVGIGVCPSPLLALMTTSLSRLVSQLAV
ncbi:NuoM family protein [Accumulibacter sp.]|uniref:complex I subunit 4 family protein n=1 Tax=Accumulibacter sp. TaxID=2053492 RepID=UPI0025FCAD4F|nr:NADH-quinone oxidoreductase subunit M [Accumulibacter sp.]MCM8594629.1 NADH-quinone oxidoreductase subunit M [Accumulibacter sp.]MDS4048775.1 NADH-quinone oxidoreductase subunit M [Accumulibacter sp.]